MFRSEAVAVPGGWRGLAVAEAERRKLTRERHRGSQVLQESRRSPLAGEVNRASLGDGVCLVPTWGKGAKEAGGLSTASPKGLRPFAGFPLAGDPLKGPRR